MSIPTGGFAALLVVATLAVTGCGSDDGTATATTVVTVPATAAKTTAAQQTTAKAPSTTTQTTTQRTQTTPSTSTQKTQTTAPAPTPAPVTAKEAGLCESIGVGLRDGDVDTTYARITRKTKLTCPQAANIVAQWGAQQIGIDKALLPIGWECTSGNVCSNGKRSVTFVLEYPQE